MRRNLTHKLVFRSKGDSELYVYTEDPRELSNLYDNNEYKVLKDDLVAGLLAWLVETSDVTPKHTDPRGTPKYPHPASACATSGIVGPTAVLQQEEHAREKLV